MSTTIDQRVVEMRFDNKHFEENVSTTMSTLDKLKQKLDLKGATNGLENIDKATRNVKMDGLGGAVDAVSAKFSALQVMGVTALANITNSAVNAGKSIIKSLTIDPIKTGFQEYETKMGSIQTILANTEHQGTTLDDVTAALDKLNTYADKTIYNFQQMTKNIGTFTAAGVDLQTSVESIQGIANLAAVSGSTSQQASTAMYQLSQALASGTVKLMDWNSVVNAGMGGKVFQNALIRTAAMLDDSADDVAGWQKEHIDAYGSFRESLTKEAWLTTEVLTTTLKQFTMAAEEGSDEWNAFKKSLMETGYTEAQAEEILKMANTATDAATKVKTFTQLMDTLKESAQSGWAQTWELIVGDFEEAKSFFTELSDIFGGIIGESADRRNTFLGDALSSNWDKLIAKINEAGIETSRFEESIRKIVGDDKLDTIITDFGSLEKAIREGGISSEILKKALDNIGLSNADDKVASFVDGLKEIKGMLSRGDVSDDVKKLQTALDALGYDLGKWGVDGYLGPVTEKAIRAFQEANDLIVDGIAGPQTLGALEKAGEKINETTDEVDGLIDSCDELVDAITKKSGRELILESLMNIIKAIQRPLSAVGEAIRNTFSISSDQLYRGLEKINKFTKSLVPKGVLDASTWDEVLKSVKKLGIETGAFESKLKGVLEDHGIDVSNLIKKYGDLGAAFKDGAISFDTIKEALLGFDGITESLIEGGETVDKIRRSFEGLFAIVDIIGTVLAGPLKLAFNVTTDVLRRMGLTVLDVTAGIGDSIVAFRDNVDKVIDSLTTFIVDNVGKWIAEFKETEIFKTLASWFKDAAEKISDALDNISRRISEFDTSTLAQRLASIANFISNIAYSIRNSKLVSAIIDGVVAAFGRLKAFFGKFKLPEFNLDNLKNFSTNLVKIGEKISGSGDGSFLGAIAGFGKHLKDNVISWNWTVFKETALEKFVNFWLTTGDKIKSAFEKGKEVAQAIKRFIFGTEEVTLPGILEVAEKFLGILVFMKTLNLLNGLVEPFDNITDALNNLASSFKWKAIGSAFKSMALAIGVFTLCIVALTQIDDMGKAWQAAGMLAALMVVMGGIIAGMGALSNKIGSGMDAFTAGAAIIMMVGALALLVYTIKEIDKLKLENPGETFAILGGVLLAMTIGVRAISKAGGSSFRSVAAILTMMAALKMLLDVIDAYDEYDWTGKQVAIRRVMEMLVGLSLAVRIASGGTKAGASSAGLAMLLLVMVVSLKMLVGVIEDFAAMDGSTLKKGGAIVVALLGMFTLMAVALNMTNKGGILEKGQRSVNNFAGLAIALLAVVASIWLLGKMDIETLKQGGYAVGQILLLFTAMLTSIGLACKGASGLSLSTLIVTIVGVGLLITLVGFIIQQMTKIPIEQSIGSAKALAIVLLALAGVVFALKYVSTSSMGWSDIGKLGALFGGLLVVLGVLGLVLAMMSGLNTSNAIVNATSLSIMLVAIAAVLFALNKINVSIKWGDMAKLGAMFVGLTVILAGLGLVLAMMSGLDTKNSIGNAAALGVLLGVMSGVLFVLSKLKIDPSGTAIAIAGLAALGLVVWEIGAILRKLTSNGLDGDAIGTVMALSALLIVLTGVLAALTGLGAIMAASGFMVGIGMAIALAGLAALGLVVWEIGAIIRKLKQNGLDGSAIGTVNVLSEMLITMTKVLAALSVIGIMGIPALAATAVLAALGLVVWEIGAIVRKLNSSGLDSSATGTVNVLSELLTVLVGALKTLAVIGIFAVPALAGVILLGALALELGLAIFGLSKIKDTDTAKANVETITQLLESLSSMIVLVAMIGPNALIATAAISGLVLLVEGLTLFAGAVGTLATLFGNGIETVIQKGLGILKIVAAGLGEIVSAFMTSATANLPQIADNLSQFTEKLSPFISAVGGLDESVLIGAGYLAGAVLAIIGADAITDLIAFFSGGGVTLISLADELSGFAEGMLPFVDAMSGMKADAAVGVKALCEAISALTSANLKDALVNLLPGDNTLSTFGENISAFATCIKDAAIVLTGITDADVENIKRAARAGEALASLNSVIPREGGLWQQIAGSQDLASWGVKISAFADSLVAYSAKVSGQTIDSDAIQKSADAGTAISNLNSSIPKEGGLWQSIAGAQDIASWGTKIVTFADALVSYSDTVSGANLDTDAIIKSAEAAGALAEVNNELPKEDGAWQWIMGEQNMASFGSGLKYLADGIVSYSTAAEQITDTKIAAIEKSGAAVDALKTVSDKLPNTGGVGELLWGDKNPKAFGNGVSALANGIKTCVDTATTITDSDITAISNLGTALTEIETVFTDVPDINTQYTANFDIAVGNLKSACAKIAGICAARYSFSGLTPLGAEMSKIFKILDNIDVGGAFVDFANLHTVTTYVEKCAVTLSKLNGYTYGGIDTLKGALNSLAEANVDGVITAFSGKAESMTSAVTSVVNALSTGLSGGSTTVSTAATSLADAAVRSIENKKSAFGTAGETWTSNLADGVSAGQSKVTTNFGTVATACIKAVTSKYSRFKTAGGYLVEGFAKGISEKTWYAEAKAAAMADAAYEAARKALDINSPSKIFRSLGYSVPEGFAMGIDRMSYMAEDSAVGMADTTYDTVKGTIAQLASALSTDIDAQPTIRPVLDLSDVRSGAGAINSMFGNGVSVDMLANVNSINSMMNRRSQNGANAEVVSAIDKLNRKMDNLGNTTYSINGITYDDGSSVADAMRTIVRYATIERRV